VEDDVKYKNNDKKRIEVMHLDWSNVCTYFDKVRIPNVRQESILKRYVMKLKKNTCKELVRDENGEFFANLYDCIYPVEYLTINDSNRRMRNYLKLIKKYLEMDLKDNFYEYSNLYMIRKNNDQIDNQNNFTYGNIIKLDDETCSKTSLMSCIWEILANIHCRLGRNTTLSSNIELFLKYITDVGMVKKVREKQNYPLVSELNLGEICYILDNLRYAYTKFLPDENLTMHFEELCSRLMILSISSGSKDQWNEHSYEMEDGIYVATPNVIDIYGAHMIWFMRELHIYRRLVTLAHNSRLESICRESSSGDDDNDDIIEREYIVGFIMEYSKRDLTELMEITFREMCYKRYIIYPDVITYYNSIETNGIYPSIPEILNACKSEFIVSRDAVLTNYENNYMEKLTKMYENRHTNNNDDDYIIENNTLTILIVNSIIRMITDKEFVGKYCIYVQGNMDNYLFTKNYNTKIPLILEWFNHYHVLYNGNISKGMDFTSSLVMWMTLSRKVKGMRNMINDILKYMKPIMKEIELRKNNIDIRHFNKL